MHFADLMLRCVLETLEYIRIIWNHNNFTIISWCIAILNPCSSCGIPGRPRFVPELCCEAAQWAPEMMSCNLVGLPSEAAWPSDEMSRRPN